MLITDHPRGLLFFTFRYWAIPVFQKYFVSKIHFIVLRAKFRKGFHDWYVQMKALKAELKDFKGRKGYDDPIAAMDSKFLWLELQERWIRLFSVIPSFSITLEMVSISVYLKTILKAFTTYLQMQGCETPFSSNCY